MRRLLLVLVMLSLAGPAMSSGLTANTPGPKPAGDYSYTPPDGTRQAGDTIGSSTPIGALPFTDTGTTSGYFDDYDEACPYSGSLSPDVVYSYTPSTDVCVNIDLCYSLYDTKVYIYENDPSNLVACNDDFHFDAPCYEYSSALNNIPLTVGNVYYIVVDGYSGAFGSYQIDITTCSTPPPFDCPAGALQENEPLCQDGYVDHYNGGCGSNPTIWQPVEAPEMGGCATMCGYSCTYVYQGSSFRDTDWFSSLGIGGTVTLTSVAEFALQSILIYGTDCSDIQFIVATSGPGIPNTLSYYIANNAEVWTWEAPQGFSGVPYSQYKFEICGIAGGANPIEATSWGSLKRQYR